MWIASPDLLDDSDLFEAIVSLDESMITKKLYHIILFGETLLSITLVLRWGSPNITDCISTTYIIVIFL